MKFQMTRTQCLIWGRTNRLDGGKTRKEIPCVFCKISGMKVVSDRVSEIATSSNLGRPKSRTAAVSHWQMVEVDWVWPKLLKNNILVNNPLQRRHWISLGPCSTFKRFIGHPVFVAGLSCCIPRDESNNHSYVKQETSLIPQTLKGQNTKAGRFDTDQLWKISRQHQLITSTRR